MNIQNKTRVHKLCTDECKIEQGVYGMGFTQTSKSLNQMLNDIVKDLTKAERGNKAAAQRVRTGTVRLEKVAKKFRRESIVAQKQGKFDKMKLSKVKKPVSKKAKKPAKARRR